ncbi:N-acetylglucosamine-specific PTS transporter subunit IIBC [Clostridium gasigenes]|uniref:PTS system, N-acetylglucosamine-specific IIC component n=1 Tax=Clostridium gasigenes TaxID=94869 RepID=A0A1H0VQ53_9CLOT|nr:N-acetylglucosamine-specific PTS transporter subunit IIBC [Clostridium gasigenes]MBU3089555.1 N-acetylglucosamine-specific PTS transporter subunit IIBC [Clostridium gasigenes]SDP80647.1 PTS system, N-acetylglucosamine-specific IIC component [Clostridium gasigenes]
MGKAILGYLQRIGKSLMLPIAALPVAGLMLRLGQGDLLNIAWLAAAGGALFDNLPLIFAIGVAVGLSDDDNGAAALAGAIGYLVLTKVSSSIWEARFGVDVAKTLKFDTLGGIITGIVAGHTYNKFKNVKLPEILGFFGGRRLVPIMTSFFMIILAGIFGYIWQPIQEAITSFGMWMVGLGAVGSGLFGFFNRLLIPMGLHHVLNSIFWFTIGDFGGKSGDLNRFFVGDPTAGIYMGGFFPVMMFGMASVALAIVVCAKKEKRTATIGLLSSLALTAFLTGITEPIEFLFIFLSPLLLIAHALITGLSMFITTSLGVLHGFTFSAGALDYVMNFGIATKPILIIPIGLAIGALYFVVFVFLIKRFDIPTPGRENDDDEFMENVVVTGDMAELAKSYIEYLGGKDNIVSVDNCITRLRLEVKDNTIVKDAKLRALGARGVVRPSKKNVQIIVGTNVQFLADAIKSELKRGR